MGILASTTGCMASGSSSSYLLTTLTSIPRDWSSWISLSSSRPPTLDSSCKGFLKKLSCWSTSANSPKMFGGGDSSF
jgi:hypothetical protein